MSHQRFLVVVTSQCVRVITICSNYKLETIPHREWEPSGVACHENGTHLVISLGQGQGYSRESAECRITLCKYELDSLPRKLSYSSFKLPTEHRPKRISLDADGSIVTCVTTIQNKLLVWEVHEDFIASKEPFDFVKNHYAVERYEIGITSTSLYITPSQKRYILATTSPSSKRQRNDGEWSFRLSLPSSSTQQHQDSGRLALPSTTSSN